MKKYSLLRLANGQYRLIVSRQLMYFDGAHKIESWEFASEPLSFADAVELLEDKKELAKYEHSETK